MLPQLLDNIAYLVVCLPPPDGTCKTIVAFLVDCGDANAALTQIFDIRDVHYLGYEIDLQCILCTHKHHDHTAGNRGLLASDLVNVQHVVGGAVEKVPLCNTFVANGDFVTLPTVEGNDMNNVVEMEVMAMPAHTRGSVVYALRVKQDEEGSVFFFVGDTMFSGGGGVPFEADTETRSDQRVSNKNGGSQIKPSVGNKSVERCFAEILHRGSNNGNTSKMLIFPGHEYTSDLIARQFRSGAGETSAWNRMPPSVFFETASQYYISSHRRALPHSGKMLTVPTVVSRELYINPHFRSLKKRGEHIIRALRIWYRHFSKDKIDDMHPTVTMMSSSSAIVPKLNDSNKTPSTETEWNLTTDDISRPIFTTVFSMDLEAIIEDLGANRISPQRAAKRLRSMQSSLEDNLIRRRPIPETLPTDKSIYQGILALAILGSGPCAMTLSDSHTMKLPIPNDYDSDRIRISKKRLLSVLNALELLTAANDGHKVIQIIDFLWKDAAEYCDEEKSVKVNGTSNFAGDSVENGHSEPDEIELGVIKWCLYGAEANQPSWFTKFCMLCEGEVPREPVQRPAHPVQAMNLRRTNGELVRHDVLRCPLCRDATGCPLVEDISESFTTEESPRKEMSLADAIHEDSPSTAVEVELPTFHVREESSASLPFDEEDSDAEKIEMQAIIKPMLTEA